MVIRHKIYESNPFGHGGEKRTAQISMLLDKIDVDYTILTKTNTKIVLSLKFLFSLFNTCILFIKVMFIIKTLPGTRQVFKTILAAANRLLDYKNVENNRVLLWEATRLEQAYCIPYFKKKKYNIIAFPQNLESLVPTQRSAISGKESPSWLMEEIRILQQCDTVFTISKEETLFLKQCGINAMYLPYYPSRDVVVLLENIRAERKKRSFKDSGKKKILMLGSAINPPTKLGMIDRINFFSNNTEIDCETIIAGYSTESLKEYIKESDNISVLGELTEIQLSDLLIQIDCVLIHQPPTSGALMRITELLIAGVPVVANFVSARNYYGTDGVYVYENNDGLVKLLNQDLIVPQMPSRPTHKAFIEIFASL